MRYILRGYQQEAVDAAVNFFEDKNIGWNAIEILPTGSGKSLVIANIAKKLDRPTLIFQPSKEILEQNFAKYVSYGERATIYSASVGQKKLSDVTFATIGSVIKKPEILRGFEYMIIDECHFVNAKQGMYRDLLAQLRAKVLGLTATPYRLVTDGFGGSILKFLTRTRPRVFRDVIYYVQNESLFDSGYLAKLKYKSTNGFDRKHLVLNSTGADFTDMSVQRYYKKINFRAKVAEETNRLIAERKGVLVFTRFVDESKYLVSRIPGSAVVTGKTPKKEREKILGLFRSGRIKAVCNVGVLTTGFDYPELDAAILARPTRSLALYYQMIGRTIRPAENKSHSLIVDMCDNFRMFGPVEKLELVDGGNGKWFISNNGKQLTNVYYGERQL